MGGCCKRDNYEIIGNEPNISLQTIQNSVETLQEGFNTLKQLIEEEIRFYYDPLLNWSLPEFTSSTLMLFKEIVLRCLDFENFESAIEFIKSRSLEEWKILIESRKGNCIMHCIYTAIFLIEHLNIAQGNIFLVSGIALTVNEIHYGIYVDLQDIEVLLDPSFRRKIIRKKKSYWNC